MNRPLHIWSIFAVCALVLLGGMAWITSTTLRLEKAQFEAQQAAEFEERVRLALWRMDSLLTPIIVEESARPAAHYKPFLGAAQMKGSAMLPELALPSPLIQSAPTHALLYFELAPDGGVTSPTVGNGRPERQRLAQLRTAETVRESLARLESLKVLLTQNSGRAGQTFRMTLTAAAAASARTNQVASVPTNAFVADVVTIDPAQVMQNFSLKAAEVRQFNDQVQVAKNVMEFQARANAYQQAAQASISAFANSIPQGVGQIQVTPNVVMTEAPMTPVWLGSALVLVRQVNTPKVVQGVWLNWDELKGRLKENVRDLFPQADLRPASGTAGGRKLASVPVEFVPGAPVLAAVPAWTSARVTLAIAWGCVLVAVLAVALLLHGAVSLSERRGDFVSAVTHELRTPLTTFKMYSEMLADGMVTEESKRQSYLATLCAEANRLGHLVENVLAYARLERGSARRRVERMTLHDLIERTLPRLRERTERAGMELIIDSDEKSLATLVHVDAGAVEQILFNLVDNACKYAAPHATEKLIHLEALPDGKFAMLRVRDHGAGISAEGAKRLFKPFSKTAQEAAHSAPGIGLGLALCRRLSRSLGGELRFVAQDAPGACFELRLPLAQ